MFWGRPAFALLLALLIAAVGCAPRVSVEVSASIDGQENVKANETNQAGQLEESEPVEEGVKSQESPQDSPIKMEGVIAFSALTFTNPFFVVIADNLKSEAIRYGFEVIVDDADRDVRRQSEHIDSYITRGVAAIVINPCDRKSIGPAIKKANDAGIPVFTCDLQCVAEGADVTGHVGTDNFQGGELAGRAMIEALDEAGGKVLILHFKQANSCVLRVDGFRQVIDRYNEDRQSGRIEVVSELEGGGLRDPAFVTTSAALQTNPDLAGIFAINDPSALGAFAALEQAGKTDQVVIIAFDGQLDGKQAIKEGKIYADPIQFPDKMGRQTVEKIVKYLNGDSFQRVTLIPTELYRQQDAMNDEELK